MQVNYSPLQDLMIASGIDLLKENPQMQTSYSSHRFELGKQTYSQFLKNIETNLSDLDSPQVSSERRLIIASKLKDLATQQINQKESKTNAITKFFQKIKQLYLGHGFQTKGEWGIKLSGKIEEWDKHEYHLVLLRKYLSGPAQDPPKELIERMKIIGKEDLSRFIYVFINSYEDSKRPEKKNKLRIYENLSQEQKVMLEDQLFEDGRIWVNALNIIEGADLKSIEAFITSRMVNSVKTHWLLFYVYNGREKEGTLNQSFHLFYSVIVAKAIKELLYQRDYKSINILIQRANNHRAIEKIFLDPQCFTTKEIDLLKENCEQVYF